LFWSIFIISRSCVVNAESSIDRPAFCAAAFTS